MKIVSVINYKGGVGKTTLTANLGGELAYRGHKVLIIDLDPQASLTFSFFTPDAWRDDLAKSRTLKNWFQPDKNEPLEFDDLILRPAKVARFINDDGILHLIASHLELINVDLELATELGGANPKQQRENFFKVHTRLLEGIKSIRDHEYDFVLIDCPPNFNIVTKNAIVASDYILVPAKPDYLSTLGINYLKRSIDGLVEDYNWYSKDSHETIKPINPQILGVVFTMVQFIRGEPIKALQPFILNLKRQGTVNVFKTELRENKTAFAEAPEDGVPVVLLNSVNSDIREELERFVQEFEDKIADN